MISELESIVGKEYVLTRYEDKLPYIRDASYYRGSEPLAVVIPSSAQEISKILKLANETKTPVFVRGGGTSLTGSSIPMDGGIVISMSRFDRILELSLADRYVVAEAGVRIDTLNSYLSRYNFFYPPDPASSVAATVGGSINTNAGGLRAVMYGATKEWVLGLEVVLPTGEIAHFGGKVLKRSLGYDLTALIIGSEGTLGIVTKAILKIAPMPKETGRILAYYDSIEKAGRSISELKERGITPIMAEFMDRISMESVKKAKGIDYPEGASYMIIVDITSTKESIERELNEAMEILKKTEPVYIRVTRDREEMEKIYLARKGLYSSQLVERQNPEQYVVIGDIVVPSTKIPEALKDIESKISEYGFKVSLFGHIGDGNIHINIFVNPNNDEEMKRAGEFLMDTGKIAIKYEGSVSSEHGIGIEKKELLYEEFREKNSLVTLDLMKRIKRVIDPNNILNRGKLLE